MSNKPPISPEDQAILRKWGHLSPEEIERMDTKGPMSVSRAEANNNPGNIVDGPFARKQPGYIGSDGKFAKFKQPEDGLQAQITLLGKNYAGRTPETLILGEGAPGHRRGGYAPLNEDGGDNTPAAAHNYVARVAKGLGIGPNDPIPADKIPQLVDIMNGNEAGHAPEVSATNFARNDTRPEPDAPGYQFDQSHVAYMVGPDGKKHGPNAAHAAYIEQAIASKHFAPPHTDEKGHPVQGAPAGDAMYPYFLLDPNDVSQLKPGQFWVDPTEGKLHQVPGKGPETDQALGWEKGVGTVFHNAYKGAEWLADKVTPDGLHVQDNLGIPTADELKRRAAEKLEQNQFRGVVPGKTGEFIGSALATIPTLAIPGGPLGLVGRAALSGAASGALTSDATTASGAAWDAAKGAGLGLATHGLVSGAGRVIAPRISDDLAQLADNGVKTSTGQTLFGGSATPSKIGNYLPGVNAARQRATNSFGPSAVNEVVGPLGGRVPNTVKNTEEALSWADDFLDHARVNASTPADLTNIAHAADRLGVVGQAAVAAEGRMGNFAPGELSQAVRGNPINGLPDQGLGNYAKAGRNVIGYNAPENSVVGRTIGGLSIPIIGGGGAGLGALGSAAELGSIVSKAASGGVPGAVGAGLMGGTWLANSSPVSSLVRSLVTAERPQALQAGVDAVRNNAFRATPAVNAYNELPDTGQPQQYHPAPEPTKPPLTPEDAALIQQYRDLYNTL